MEAQRGRGREPPGGSLSRLRQEILDYFAQVEELDQDSKVTNEVPEYPPAPRLLALFNKLDKWGCLPCAGGYYDQPANLMRHLDVVRSAVQERLQIEAANRVAAEATEAKPADGVVQTQTLPGL